MKILTNFRYTKTTRSGVLAALTLSFLATAGCGDTENSAPGSPKQTAKAIAPVDASSGANTSDPVDNMLSSLESEFRKADRIPPLQVDLINDQKQSLLLIRAPYVSGFALFDALYGQQTPSCKQLNKKFESLGADWDLENQKIQIETSRFFLSSGVGPLLTCGRSISIIAVKGIFNNGIVTKLLSYDDSIVALKKISERKIAQGARIPSFAANVELSMIDVEFNPNVKFEVGEDQYIVDEQFDLAIVLRGALTQRSIRGNFLPKRTATENSGGSMTGIKDWLNALNASYSVSEPSLVKRLQDLDPRK